ncbi:acetyl-CoA carboxylase carboxyl transferase subunit beta [Alkalithermobacter thermoalcaliphilus JW-YL-7 = DSM 7308]|uniref:Acetyl-coenzyme A carboxylase carboxyl transferase subunit beta n=1 Tax=Alkalithermobacter thermoalcaliphilus JW-YL-7 = DSM 7308 TaxID=1121328 RepID=A0A150FQG9_CLOPD|nr:Acetyl-coenzyme A carboxylase carboxyl transferase subunit beta [[Clostridium] paradoxum JW-YL-7 = DSM 7308]SHK79331.1 acetyl-CoA carboxylase carboxyl transferase subunit beta [[Clostridium] paradoxum JW-YL-7 = DSM 7308]
MIKKLLNKNKEYANLSMVNNFQNNSLDEKFWMNCPECKKNIFKKDVEENLYICPKCDYHLKLPARQRIDLLIDTGTFTEFDKNLYSKNILNFPEYENKLNLYKDKTNENDAVITGTGKINGLNATICVMNTDFMMGSMGAVVGEKITRAATYSIENKIPFIIISSSGGARMQEGIISLMQMAKTAQELRRLSEYKIPYISILTDPTTGGVTASFAMLGDIIIAEPKALIGFAGPRVIEQTIKQTLPDGFQRAEFLLEKGFVDIIVNRKDMKNMLFRIIKMHGYQEA